MKTAVTALATLAAMVPLAASLGCAHPGSPADYSANDMNVPLSQLYAGTAAPATQGPGKSREQVLRDYEQSRKTGTSAAYTTMGGYQMSMTYPGLIPEPRSTKTREEVFREWQRSQGMESVPQ